MGSEEGGIERREGGKGGVRGKRQRPRKEERKMNELSDSKRDETLKRTDSPVW